MKFIKDLKKRFAHVANENKVSPDTNLYVPTHKPVSQYKYLLQSAIDLDKNHYDYAEDQFISGIYISLNMKDLFRMAQKYFDQSPFKFIDSNMTIKAQYLVLKPRTLRKMSTSSIEKYDAFMSQFDMTTQELLVRLHAKYVRSTDDERYTALMPTLLQSLKMNGQASIPTTSPLYLVARNGNPAFGKNDYPNHIDMQLKIKDFDIEYI